MYDQKGRVAKQSGMPFCSSIYCIIYFQNRKWSPTQISVINMQIKLAFLSFSSNFVSVQILTNWILYLFRLFICRLKATQQNKSSQFF